jgi:hypothetical protein
MCKKAARRANVRPNPSTKRACDVSTLKARSANAAGRAAGGSASVQT